VSSICSLAENSRFVNAVFSPPAIPSAAEESLKCNSLRV
jgi:hypothetical protein